MQFFKTVFHRGEASIFMSAVKMPKKSRLPFENKNKVSNFFARQNKNSSAKKSIMFRSGSTFFVPVC